MREQPTRIKTGAKRKRAMMIAAIFITVTLAAAIIFAINYQHSYTPPPFESRAVVGVPHPPEMLKHTRIDAGSFAFKIAGVLQQQEDGSLQIYLTNPEENEVYLMCEILTSDGEAIYRSGLLRPGEYVVSLPPIAVLGDDSMDVRINIYALERDFFFSAGTVTLRNILQPQTLYS